MNTHPTRCQHHDRHHDLFGLDEGWWSPGGRKFGCAILAATAGLGWILSTTDPAWAVTTNNKVGYSNTAAQIHLNSLPPTTISVQIDDLPVIGSLLSGTYSKVLDSDSDAGRSSRSSTSGGMAVVPVTIRSPTDKVAAIANIASAGHLEFDLDGIVNTHVDIDFAASNAGVATIKVDSAIIPRLPFRNAASGLVPPAARMLKLAKKQPPPGADSAASSLVSGASAKSATAAQVAVNSLPPSAISVEIRDLPVFGKALSGVYAKVDDSAGYLLDHGPAAVTIESPRDKVAAIKAIASTGHLEFDIDGVLNTHLDVDIATDSVGSATIRVASPIIPALPFQNSASY
jgi:glyoxylase-like metal-dependent hydrolase (beta-lactamase superfamily II)